MGTARVGPGLLSKSSSAPCPVLPSALDGSQETHEVLSLLPENEGDNPEEGP